MYICFCVCIYVCMYAFMYVCVYELIIRIPVLMYITVCKNFTCHFIKNIILVTGFMKRKF